LDGFIDSETFAARKGDLLVRRRALVDERESGETVTFWRNVAERFELGFGAYLGYETGTETERREILEKVGSDFVVDGKTPAFTLQFPFDELRSWAFVAQGARYDGAVRTGRSGLARGERAPVSALIERLARQEPGASSRWHRNKSLKSPMSLQS